MEGSKGCTGCNLKGIDLSKSKIRDNFMKGSNDPVVNSEDNRRRRYDTWNGVGCGGCGLIYYPILLACGGIYGYQGPYFPGPEVHHHIPFDGNGVDPNIHSISGVNGGGDDNIAEGSVGG